PFGGVATALDSTRRIARAHHRPGDPDVERVGGDRRFRGRDMDPDRPGGLGPVEPSEPRARRAQAVPRGRDRRADPIGGTGGRIGEGEEPDLVSSGPPGGLGDIVRLAHATKGYESAPTRAPRMARRVNPTRPAANLLFSTAPFFRQPLRNAFGHIAEAGF